MPIQKKGRAVRKLDRAHVASAVQGFLEKRRPADPAVRANVDLGFRFYNQTIELFEIRPRWDKKPGKTEHAFAKAIYVKATGAWKVYWMRGNLEWQRYNPPNAKSLGAFLKLVDGAP